MSRTRPTAILTLLTLAWTLSACRPAPVTPDGQAASATPGTETTPFVAAPTAQPTPTLQPTSAFTQAGSALGGLKVHLWHSWAGETAAEMQRLETDFNGSNPWGIWLEVNQVPGGEALDTALEPLWDKTELPEVVLASVEQARGWDARYQQVVDLSPYLADPEWGMPQADQQDFFPVFWDSQADANRRLGIPALGTAQVLYYNQSWAQELGFDAAPASPEQLREQVCAAARANRDDQNWDNDGTGGWLIDTQPLTAASWVRAFGVDWQPEAGGGYRFDAPESQAAFTYLKETYDQGCFWVGRQPDPFAYLAGRNALVITASLNAGDEAAWAFTSAETADRWTVLAFPTQGGQAAPLASASSWQVLSGTAEEQLAAWLVVRWFSQVDVQTRLARLEWDFPTRSSALDALDEQTGQPAAWIQGAALLRGAQAAPVDAGWAMAARILQDAYRQLFQADTQLEQIPDILKEVDLTIGEMEQYRP